MEDKFLAEQSASRAKYKLRSLFGISEGESNGDVEDIVDCIIQAAVLETALAQKEASGTWVGWRAGLEQKREES